MFCCGLLYATAVFDSVARRPFNFTYFESNMISSSGMLGFAFSFDVVFLLPRISPMWLCVVGCIGSTLSNLLLWSTTKSYDMYAKLPGLLCLYTFLVGHSYAFLYQTAVHVCLKNVQKFRWGQLLGALHVPFGVSSIFFVLISLKFLKGEVSTIFLVYSVISGVVGFGAIFGLRKLKQGPKSQTLSANYSTDDVRALTTGAFEYAPSDTGSNAGDTDTDEERGEESRDIQRNMNNTRPTGFGEINSAQGPKESKLYPRLGCVLVSCDFQCLLWIFTLTSGALIDQLRNLEIFLRAGMADDISASQVNWEISKCLLVFSVTMSVARVGSGILSDILVNKVPRINFLLVGIMCHCVTGILACVAVQNVVGVWVVLSLTGGLCYGLLWSICPTILAVKYGVKNFSFLWSLLLVFSVLFAIVVQVGLLSIGSSFHSMDYHCSKQCVQLDVAVNTVLCGCALFLSCGYAASK